MERREGWLKDKGERSNVTGREGGREGEGEREIGRESTEKDIRQTIVCFLSEL